ncbi:hypothetical protein HMPREF2826_03960 [Olsenella sp. HMSC062G07]|nr:hypothetical protein HMPREF2826_03960 [Olsenella sp. HMSC062G07]
MLNFDMFNHVAILRRGCYLFKEISSHIRIKPPVFGLIFRNDTEQVMSNYLIQVMRVDSGDTPYDT